MIEHSFEQSGYLFPDVAPKSKENEQVPLSAKKERKSPVQDAEEAGREIIKYASITMRKLGLYFNFRPADD